MAETIGLLCLILIGVTWILITLLKKFLNKRTELKMLPLDVKKLGLSREQEIRLCALARAQGITWKTLWRCAGLEYLDRYAGRD